MMIIGPEELSLLVNPQLIPVLRERSKYQGIFPPDIETTSLYDLPSYIDPDILIQTLRQTLSDAFVFIHTWIEKFHKNPHADSDISDNLLTGEYKSYQEFFDEMLSIIDIVEEDAIIRNTAYDLGKSLRHIYPYLGNYNGDLKNSLYKVSDIFNAILLTCIIYNITNYR